MTRRIDATPCHVATAPNGAHVLVKRDDLYEAPGGAIGGKARTCEHLLRAWKQDWAMGMAAHVAHSQPPETYPLLGVVTAGSRHSPQVQIVTAIAEALEYRDIRIHTPGGDPGPEVAWAVDRGAYRLTHRPGYNSVITARARQDALDRGYCHVPFGMECAEAVGCTADAVADVSAMLGLQNGRARRLVVPVGSGMSLAGILRGLERIGRNDVPVLGVQVGADPTRRLDTWAPATWKLWPGGVTLALGKHAYSEHVQATLSSPLGDIVLDPVYEAKCAAYLRDGDLFWLVGRRATLTTTTT
jgi:1-aminocyclopropane-1-carboxylate deaminase/D-cysteine desulfhydrase-like pyridoxal-dependent ACC family enzyme